MPDQITCQQFTDFLIRRTPHYDLDILRDVTPVRGWIGQVPTGAWGAFEGTSKIGHRIRRMFPSLSSCWTSVVESGCIGTPCDPVRKKVGFGFDQFTYNLEEIYYETDIFCFPLIMSADAAKEQFSALIMGLREATIWIWNHRYRTEAVRVAKRKVLAGAGITDANPVFSADCTNLTVSGEPTSILTIQFLQRFVEPLILEGYMGENPLPAKMFIELITDVIASNDLRENNPALSNYLRLGQVADFAELYRYGITGSIGNFLIHPDPTPLRYQKINATTYNIVFPYENMPASEGIAADENWAYVNSRYQWSFLWHRMAMRSLVRRSEPINSQMPFGARDFGGRWKFVMDNMTCRDEETGELVPVDNVERTKGKFIANFSAGTKPEHPEWAVAIFHLRQISCVTDITPCAPAVTYYTQDYSSANAPCPQDPMDYPVSGSGPWIVVEASCNGTALGGLPSAAFDTLAELVTFLNSDLSAYGTWSNPDAVTIRLSDSTCAEFDLVIENAG